MFLEQLKEFSLAITGIILPFDYILILYNY